VGLESAAHPKAHRYGDVLLVVGPEHLDTLTHDGYATKEHLRARVQEVTAKPFADVVSDDEVGGGASPSVLSGLDEGQRRRPVPKFAGPENIHIVVAGAEAGKWSAFFAGWTTGPGGTIPTSRVIDE
ncbi:MAG: TlpA family protein disulfide reductase, partial [Chloroflexi bacterium]